MRKWPESSSAFSRDNGQAEEGKVGFPVSSGLMSR